MTVFSPSAVMRVLTTLVDRSLDEPETAAHAREPRRRSRRAHFSQANEAGVLQTHLELAGREDRDDKLREFAE